MSDIQIVDIIVHRNKHFTQTMLVTDRMPKFVYERRGSTLIGHDSGFFNFYGYESTSRDSQWKAFGGSEFDIPMVDGSAIQAWGQWWSVFPRDFAGLTYDHGVSTVDRLSECNVFTGGIHVDRELVDKWLDGHEPSNNYHKYNGRHADAGKQTIVSPWQLKGKGP